MTNDEQNYAEISFRPKEIQDKVESTSPWFVQDAEGAAARADTVVEMMALAAVKKAV